MIDNDGRISPVMIKHYDLLKEIGVLEQIEGLQREIKDLEELLSDAAPLVFNQHSVEDLVTCVTNILLEKFIPGDLVFILKTGVNDSELQLISYANLKETSTIIKVPSIEPYRAFFKEYPNTISFSLFEYKLNKKAATRSFEPVSPEIIVPIMGLAGLQGLVVFGRKILDEDYSPREITYLDRLMKFTSISLQNIINFTNASMDNKTRLYNHSFFTKRLEEELSRVKRYDSEIFILVLDLDHFKTVNDTYGHVAGDEILVSVARVLEKSVRSHDTVARFGGEEFVVMLTEVSHSEAWIVAERIRKAVAGIALDYEDSIIKVTVSIGGCHSSRCNPGDNQDIINKADTVLYQSKKNGRNRVTFYNPGLYFRGVQYSGKDR